MYKSVKGILCPVEIDGISDVHILTQYNMKKNYGILTPTVKKNWKELPDSIKQFVLYCECKIGKRHVERFSPIISNVGDGCDKIVGYAHLFFYRYNFAVVVCDVKDRAKLRRLYTKNGVKNLIFADGSKIDCREYCDYVLEVIMNKLLYLKVNAGDIGFKCSYCKYLYIDSYSSLPGCSRSVGNSGMSMKTCCSFANNKIASGDMSLFRTSIDIGMRTKINKAIKAEAANNTVVTPNTKERDKRCGNCRYCVMSMAKMDYVCENNEGDITNRSSVCNKWERKRIVK